MGIRVPRITLKTEFDDDVAFGDLNLLSLGYGLHQAWIYATMFASTSIFTAQTYVFSAYGVGLSLAFIVSIATFGFCLLLAAIANRRLTPLFRSRKLIGIGAALMCLGTALILPVFPFDPLSLAALEVASGLLTGIGSSILTIFWGSAFARSDATSIMLNSAFAISFAIGIYVLVLQQMPGPFGGVLAALLPLFEWAILWTKTPSKAAWEQLPRFNPLPSNRMRFLVRFGGPVFVLGTALGILRQTSISYTLGNATTSGSIAIFLAAMCATVVVLMTLIALEKSKTPNSSNSLAFSSLRFLIPAIGVAAFFLPFSLAGNSPIADVVLVAGYMCFEALMWIFFGELSHRFRLSPILVFGTGRGLLALGSLAGAIIPILLRNAGSLQSLGDEWSTMIILLALVISYAALPSDREMTAIVAPCPLILSLTDKAQRPAAGVRGATGAAGSTGAAGFAQNAAAGTSAAEASGALGAAGSSLGATAGPTATGDAPNMAANTAEATNGVSAAAAADAANANIEHLSETSESSEPGAATSAASTQGTAETTDGSWTTPDDRTNGTKTADSPIAGNRSASATAGKMPIERENGSGNEAMESKESQAAAPPDAASFHAPAAEPIAERTATNRPGSPASAAQPEAASPAQPGMPVETPTGTGTPAGTSANDQQKAPVSAARQAMLKSSKQAAEESSEHQRFGRFRRQIEDIAGRYLLSKRETEIMFYLAKGQNSAYIQEKLYISEGTAKTHIRHIYRKLDVHSQHELMRLVEDIIREESGRD